MTSRTVRVAGAILLASVTAWLSPAASAVTPPLVDDSLLPQPRPPAPPEITEQRQQCLVSTQAAAKGNTATGGQLKNFNLPAVWRTDAGAPARPSPSSTPVWRAIACFPTSFLGATTSSPATVTMTATATERSWQASSVRPKTQRAAQDSAESRQMRRSSASGSPASSSRRLVNLPRASATSTRWRWRYGPPRTWAPR